jgi:hypothetical protein
MNIQEINTISTLTIWVKSLQDNWHIYFYAHLRCSSLNRVTIPLRRALPDRKINAPLALFNYGFQVKPDCWQ